MFYTVVFAYEFDVIKRLTEENMRLKQENNELNKEIKNQTPHKLNDEIDIASIFTWPACRASLYFLLKPK